MSMVAFIYNKDCLFIHVEVIPNTYHLTIITSFEDQSWS